VGILEPEAHAGQEVGMSARRTFVVGIDASAEARAALDWALLVAPAEAHIVAVHAWSGPLLHPPGYTTLALFPDDEERQLAKKTLERLLEPIDDPRVQTLLANGRPGPQLVDAVPSADVIVVGHRGDSQVSMMLGSTANYVAHHATCPVVIVRDRRPNVPRRVVVGVDDHGLEHDANESVRALRWALDLPSVEEVHVVHAWSAYPLAWDITGATAVHVGDLEQLAHRTVERVIAAAGPVPDGVTVERSIAQALPVTGLLDAAEDAAADLIVVGTRGRGGFRGLLLGSTSMELAAHSLVPVAIVR
jgi:nucleotide-binding universal stress UspA family protein